MPKGGPGAPGGRRPPLIPKIRPKRPALASFDQLVRLRKAKAAGQQQFDPTYQRLTKTLVPKPAKPAGSLGPKRTVVPKPKRTALPPHRVAAPVATTAPRPPKGGKAAPTRNPNVPSLAPARPAGSSAPAGGGYGATTGVPGMLGPAALANAQLAPLYAELDRQAAQQAEQERQQQAAATSFTQALMAQLSGQPAQIGAEYDQATAQQAALASRSAELLGAANPNPQVQADLAAVGAPVGQQQQVASQLQAAFPGAGAVLFQGQGVIPGQALNDRKLAAMERARGLQGVTAAQGEQTLRQLLYEGTQRRNDLAARRSEVAAKYPGLLAEAQTSQADARLKRQALAVNQAIAAKELGLKVSNQVFNQAATGARLNQGAQRLKLSALQADRQWQATLRRLGIAEAGLSLRATQLEAKKRGGGFTAQQLSAKKALAADTADAAFNGWTDPKTGEFHDRISYQKALIDMVTHGIPLSIAQAAMNRFWSRPGQTMPWDPPGGGRPTVKIQTRRRAKKRGR